ncbi:hypothetical protein Rhe02_25660 [Rhizocola hellebori]|uniref:DUF3352 domain-containing protein n=1 Tax=Rhizocola hellebori TaxID=1392758 RepID=A0A8J3Q5W8_9ACTN|nr:hypothetical protein [Rhizocola hellebori]GIH04499.1 hypothetical protein Rhe02_25660 [Rhizocola hellebori]
MTEPQPLAGAEPLAEAAPVLEAETGTETLSVRRSKTPVILAGAVAVALVLGVGAFIGYRLLFGGGQPAERFPASAVAYISIDLTPSADQTVKLVKLVKKFPDHSGDADPKASIEKLLEKLEIKGIEPKRDITSWLGSRLALGAWSDPQGETYGLLAISSEDDKAATAGLTRIRDKSSQGMGFVVRDGYALIAVGGKQAQRAAEAADAEAAKSPLSAQADFSTARKWLADDQIVVAYADLGGLGRLADKFSKDLLPAGEDLGDLSKTFKGRVIGGARIEQDAILVRSRSFGAEPTQTAAIGDAIARLGALPAGSEIAAVASLPSGLSESPLAGIPLSAALIGGMGLGPSGGGLSPQEQTELNELMSKDLQNKLTPAEEARLTELMDKTSGFGPDLSPAEQKELDALFSKDELTEAEEKRVEELLGGGATGGAGPDIDAVLQTLSGATVAISMTGVADKPALSIVAALAKAPSADTISSLKEISPDLTVSVEGTTLTAKSAGFTAGGKLADDPLFKRATAGAPGNLTFAAYVDLKFAKKAGGPQTGPLTGLCLMAGTDQGDQVALARVLIG